MTHKLFAIFAGFIFFIAGLLHLIRSIAGWNLTLGTYEIPIGVSVVIFLITAMMTLAAYKLATAPTNRSKNSSKKENSPKTSTDEQTLPPTDQVA